MWFIRSMEYYSALKKEESLTCATTWMNLEDILLSETNRSQKSKIYLYEGPRVVKFVETESTMVVARSWGCGGRGNCCLVGTEFQFEMMKNVPDGWW